MDPELTRPIKELKEKWALLPSFLQARGLVSSTVTRNACPIEKGLPGIRLGLTWQAIELVRSS